MRRASRLDANQKDIIEVLEKAGFTVKSLAAVGDGCPDILFGGYGENHLAEIKDGKKPPSKQKLTPDQIFFHSKWRGDIFILHSVEETLLVISEIRRKLALRRE